MSAGLEDLIFQIIRKSHAFFFFSNFNITNFPRLSSNHLCNIPRLILILISHCFYSTVTLISHWFYTGAVPLISTE